MSWAIVIFRLQCSPNAYPSVSLGRVEEDASVALLEDADKGRAEYCRLVQTIAENPRCARSHGGEKGALPSE